jgi:hypothetical protein
LREELTKIRKEKEFEEKVKKISVENNFRFLNTFEKTEVQNWKQIAREVFGEPDKIKNRLFIYDKCVFCGKGGRGARKVHVNEKGYFCKVDSCPAARGFSWRKTLEHFGREDLLQPGLPEFVRNEFKNAFAFTNLGQARKFLKKNVKKNQQISKQRWKKSIYLKRRSGHRKNNFCVENSKKIFKELEKKKNFVSASC